MYNIDIVTNVLIILTIYLLPLIIIAQIHINYQKLLNFSFIILLFRLILTFLSTNMFIFYFYFEWSLIPIFLIIIGWGYQPERLKARLALFFYTLLASLPLLLILIKIIILRFNTNLYLITILNNNISYSSQSIILFSTIIAFLVKFPIYFVHSWLPKAHVEAPVSGSIILAGVLLKLGGYGIYRLLIFLGSNIIIEWLISLILIGGGILGIICLTQSDIKVVIAYSSVVHIALVIIGFLRIRKWGIEGGIIIILAHGVCSSGIFAGANIIYERSHSRRYLLNTGYLITIPFFSIIWFLLIVANFGGPFTYNLLGEIILILNIGQIKKIRLIILCLLSFFSACYRLVLYRSTQQGQINNISQSVKNFIPREIILLYTHVWPLLILPLSSSLI